MDPAVRTDGGSGGAMAELGRSAEIVDYVESWVFNSNKCIAVFPA
jgi:hypothetical protein